MATSVGVLATWLSGELRMYGPITGNPSIVAGRLRLPHNGSSVHLQGTQGDDWDIPGVRPIRFPVCLGIRTNDPGGAVDSEFLLITMGGAGSDALKLYGVRQGTNGYKVRAKDSANAILGTGATVFSWNIAYSLRIHRENSASRDYIEWGGLQEITGVALPDMSNTPVKFITTNIDATKFAEFDAYAGVSGDTSADRPSRTNWEATKKVPGTGAPQFGDFSVVVPAGDKWLTVDDWDTGAADDDTSYNESPANADSTFRQTYHTNDVAFTRPIQAAAHFMKHRATVNAKAITARLLSTDGTTVAESASVTYSDNAWKYLRRTWPRAPNNAVWTQTVADAWQVGARADVGPDAVALRVTAMIAEMIAFDLDPEPLVTRRRIGGQVI